MRFCSNAYKEREVRLARVDLARREMKALRWPSMSGSDPFGVGVKRSGVVRGAVQQTKVVAHPVEVAHR